MIKHIIFDLGNVLVEIHPEETMQKFARKCNIEYQQITKFFLSPLHLDFMAGKYSPTVFYQKMMEDFPCRIGQDEFVRIWKKVIGGAKEGIPELIRELDSHFELSVCSNTDVWHWESALEKVPVLKYFQHYFLSFELKVNKPDQALFTKMLSELNCNEHECIFFDDTEENIIQANSNGIHGFCTSSPMEMRNILLKMKVI